MKMRIHIAFYVTLLKNGVPALAHTLIHYYVERSVTSKRMSLVKQFVHQVLYSLSVWMGN